MAVERPACSGQHAVQPSFKLGSSNVPMDLPIGTWKWKNEKSKFYANHACLESDENWWNEYGKKVWWNSRKLHEITCKQSSSLAINNKHAK